METHDDPWHNVTMDSASRAALWTFVGMAVGFKLITSIVIFAMQPSGWSFAFLVGMHWLWFIAPFVVLGLPSLFWFRLVRVRARRRDLIRAEWGVSSELDWTPGTARGTMRKP